MLTKLWCWIVGHDTICLKLFTVQLDHRPSYTESAHQCLRCKETFDNQWDD